ncbi:lmbr1 family protein [Cyclospora cayetanensis]|uniref:Lmbr1 family protein n=1 Tax=Cyclospora cayetanensis TaxID=88456 RepID=A0A1D3CVB7_9EIME|nr:lmbr1 family protein [Cyclospora cayetanensis]
MDWLLILFLIVYLLVCLLADLRLLYLFEHQDDSGLSAQEAVGKIAIIFGLQLVWLLVLGLPLDVYNIYSPLASPGATAGLDMRVYWRCAWWFMGLYLLFILPFAVFYYEADTDPRLSKAASPKPFRRALCLTVCSVITAALVVGVCFLLFRSIHLKLSGDLCNQVNAATSGVENWAVYVLEEEYRQLVKVMKEKGNYVLMAFVRLTLGCIGSCISALWILHVFFYFVIPRITQEQPSGFLAFVDWFLEFLATHKAALLGLVIYFLLVVYFLVCVLKGCFSVGMRMFCCFAIHPMRRDGTRLNSLLFNVGLLGISTCGAVLFSYNSFQRYARGTEAALCFGVQLRHLPFFGFLLSVLHAVIYWCCCGKRRQHKQQQQLTFAPIPPPLLRMGSSKAKQQQPLQQQEGPSGRRRIEFTEGPGAPRTYEREFGAEEKAYQTPKKKKWGLIEQD